MLMEGGIWGDGVYAFSSSEKPFILFAPRRGPEFQLVIFKLINSQSRVMKSVNPGVPKMSNRLSGSLKVLSRWLRKENTHACKQCRNVRADNFWRNVI